MFRNSTTILANAVVVAVALASASTWLSSSSSFPRGVSSWIVTSPPSSTGGSRSIATKPTSRSRSPTSLGMFDWLNPNKNKDGVDEQRKEDEGGDFFSNLFKPMTQTHHEPKTEKMEEISLQTAEETSLSSSSVEEEEEETIEVIAAAAVAEHEKTAVTEDTVPVQAKVVPAEVSATVKEEEIAKTSPPEVAAAAAAATTVSTATSSSSTDTDVQIHKGKVKFFDRRRGFGFIYPWVEADGSDSTEKDGKWHYSRNEKDLVFVHFSEVQTPPEPPVSTDTPNKRTWFRTLFNREVVNYQLAVDENGRKIAKHVTGPNGGDVVSVKKQRKVAQEEDPLSP